MVEHDMMPKKYALEKLICFMTIIIFTALFMLPKDAPAQDNKPIAAIDGTLNVAVGKTVYLDGTLSSDPGGANLDYTWTLVSSPNGSQAIIISSSDPQASFEADVAGTYKVKLIVNNGSTDSAPAYAEVIVTE
jgi:chitinase